MIKVFCDMCGKDISTASKIGRLAWSFRGQDGASQGGVFAASHYCERCMDEISSFAKGRPSPAGEGQEGASQEIVGDTLKKRNNVPKAGEENPNGQGCTQDPGGKAPGLGKQAGKRKKIDYGKIMALRKAGWDNARIAEEMCMTKASVATAISTYKKKHGGQP